MQAQIVQIGNSLGLRLPKAILASMQLERASFLSIQTRGDSIVLKAIKKPRSTWAAAFVAEPDQKAENLWGDLPLTEAWDA